MGAELRRGYTSDGPTTLLSHSTLVTNSRSRQTIQPVDAAGSASRQPLLTQSFGSSKPSAGLIVTVLHTETLYRTIAAYSTAISVAEQGHNARPTPTPSNLDLLTSTPLPRSRPSQHELCVVGLASSGNLAVCRETSWASSTTRQAPSQTVLRATSHTRHIPDSHDETTSRPFTSSMATRYLVTVAAVDTSNALSSAASSTSQLTQTSTSVGEPTSTSLINTSFAASPTAQGPSVTASDLRSSSGLATSIRTLPTSIPGLPSSSPGPLFFTLSDTNSQTFTLSTSSSSSSIGVSTSSTSAVSSSRASTTAAPLIQSKDRTPSSGLILGVAIGGAASLIILLLLIVFLLRRRRQYRTVVEDAPRLPAVQVPGPLVVPLPASMDPQNETKNRVGPHRYTLRTASGHDVSTLTQSAITSYGIRLIPREEPPPNVAMAYSRLPRRNINFGPQMPPAVIDYGASRPETAQNPAAGDPTEGTQRLPVNPATSKVEPQIAVQATADACPEQSPNTSRIHVPPTRSSPGQRSLLGLPRTARSRASSHTSFETGTHTASVYSLDSQGRRRRSDPFSWQNVR